MEKNVQKEGKINEVDRSDVKLGNKMQDFGGWEMQQRDTVGLMIDERDGEMRRDEEERHIRKMSEIDSGRDREQQGSKACVLKIEVVKRKIG